MDTTTALRDLLDAITAFLAASTTPGGKPGEAHERLRAAMDAARELLDE